MRFARLVVPATVVMSVSGLGCSDPVPPTAQGAYAVTFVDTGKDCDQSGHNIVLGEVTPDSKDRLVKNGDEGSQISCDVTGNGTFNVNARASQGAAFLSVNVSGLKSKVNGGPTEDAPAPGNVSFASANTAGNVYGTQETPCDFWFYEDSNEDVDAGRVWMAFSCSAIVSAGSTCQLSTSYVIFENCTGAAEED